MAAALMEMTTPCGGQAGGGVSWIARSCLFLSKICFMVRPLQIKSRLKHTNVFQAAFGFTVPVIRSGRSSGFPDHRLPSRSGMPDQ
jgi:hypothetical protein